MAWGGIHTFVTGELVTAATMNTYLSNNLAYLHGDAGTMEIYADTDWMDVATRRITMVRSGRSILALGRDIGTFNSSGGDIAVTFAADVILKRIAARTLQLIGDNGLGGFLRLGPSAPVTNALLSAIQSSNSIEFGHESGGQYHGTLGADVGTGANFLTFHGAAGTTNSTFRSFGLKSSIIRADGSGGFFFGTVGNINADNQSLIQTAFLDVNGVFTPTRLMDASGGTMRVHRHPYSNARHIESGSVSLNDAGSGTSASVSFTDAFTAAPIVTTGKSSAGNNVGAASISTTGFTYNGTGAGAWTGYWIAEGPD